MTQQRAATPGDGPFGEIPDAAHLALSTGFDLDQDDILRRAAEQAEERGLDDVFIVDADFHQLEPGFWAEMIDYIDDEVVKHFYKHDTSGYGGVWLPGVPQAAGLQEVSGRVRVTPAWFEAGHDDPSVPRDVWRIRESIDHMKTDYVCLFPTMLLVLGNSTGSSLVAELEKHLAFAYARWMIDRVLPVEPRILTMPYLPFSDPDACVQMVEEFGDHPSIVGFLVTSARYEPIHSKSYLRLYAALEERGLPLAFHAAFSFHEGYSQVFNRFSAIHGIGMPLYNIVQATNWIVNGMPERFPNLKLLFIEGGLAWVPFLMQRLDQEIGLRSSEAPLLQRMPSEYMRDFFYTSQPLESRNLTALQHTFELIDAENQLLWSSDWPHWDWDPAARVWDLPFLDEAAKRKILGGNAQRLFGLKRPATPKTQAEPTPRNA